jgi:hypothetical protein
MSAVKVEADVLEAMRKAGTSTQIVYAYKRTEGLLLTEEMREHWPPNRIATALEGCQHRSGLRHRLRGPLSFRLVLERRRAHKKVAANGALTPTLGAFTHPRPARRPRAPAKWTNMVACVRSRAELEPFDCD